MSAGKRIALTGLAVLLTAVGFSLVHANTASAQIPTSVVVTPPTDSNDAGTPHLLSAAVTCQFIGIPIPPPGPCPAGIQVNWSITGGPGASPSGGTSATNSAGVAQFAFTNCNAPTTNFIRATAQPTGVSGFASKGWVVGPPMTFTLLPINDTNQVGTNHTVTATLRNRCNNPVPGDPVTFTVTGGGSPTPSMQTIPTNPAGQASFTFTNTVAVTNTITARENAGGLTRTATKTWIAGPPARLTLNPPTATNPVDTQHCVTATVTDTFGNPTPSRRVVFSVTGSVMTGGSVNTNAMGQAQICYTGPPLPGADAIHAYADTNNSNTQNPGEPFGDATKTWVLPMSTPGCEVKITNGGWIIASNGDRSSFGGNAKVDADGDVSGNEEYQDHGPAQPMNLHGNVLVVQCTSATSATIYGQADIGGTTYFYRLNVEDNAEPGKGADKYWMLVGNGYDSGNQILEGGNVQVHKS